MNTSSSSPFEEQLVNGQAQASWPIAVPVEGDDSIPEWLATVRQRLAVVQFQVFLKAMAKHWPPEFTALKVEVSRSRRVLFTTTEAPGLEREAIDRAEKAFLAGVSPCIDPVDKYFESLVFQGFGVSAVTPEALGEVLERALADQPELLSLVRESHLDAVLPKSTAARSSPRM